MRCTPIRRSAGSVIVRCSCSVRWSASEPPAATNSSRFGASPVPPLCVFGRSDAHPDGSSAKSRRVRFGAVRFGQILSSGTVERSRMLLGFPGSLSILLRRLLTARCASSDGSGATSSRSSKGLRSSSVSTNRPSSMLDSWSKRMACCSWGVITSCWPCRNSNLGESTIMAPIVARTYHGVKV